MWHASNFRRYFVIVFCAHLCVHFTHIFLDAFVHGRGEKNSVPGVVTPCDTCTSGCHKINSRTSCIFLSSTSLFVTPVTPVTPISQTSRPTVFQTHFFFDRTPPRKPEMVSQVSQKHPSREKHTRIVELFLWHLPQTGCHNNRRCHKKSGRARKINGSCRSTYYRGTSLNNFFIRIRHES